MSFFDTMPMIKVIVKHNRSKTEFYLNYLSKLSDLKAEIYNMFNIPKGIQKFRRNNKFHKS